MIRCMYTILIYETKTPVVFRRILLYATAILEWKTNDKKKKKKRACYKKKSCNRLWKLTRVYEGLMQICDNRDMSASLSRVFVYLFIHETANNNFLGVYSFVTHRRSDLRISAIYRNYRKH